MVPTPRAPRRRLRDSAVRSVRTRLLGEGPRETFAVGVAIVAGLVIRRQVGDVAPLDALVTTGVAALSTYQLVWFAITLVVFARADVAEVAAHAAAQPPPSDRRWYRRQLGTRSEPGVILAMSAAMAAMLSATWVLPRADELATSTLTGIARTGGILLVVGAWASMVVTYAIDYLRRDQAARGLAFPGDEQPAFMDYLYLSVAISTTFGSTDVQVTTRALRRTVAGHALLAFTFNVVVVALTIAVVAIG